MTIKASTPPSVGPSVYVVPVPGGFAVLPFKEDVGRHLRPAYAGPVLTADEVLGMVRTSDVSLTQARTAGASHGRTAGT